PETAQEREKTPVKQGPNENKVLRRGSSPSRGCDRMRQVAENKGITSICSKPPGCARRFDDLLSLTKPAVAASRAFLSDRESSLPIAASGQPEAGSSRWRVERYAATTAWMVG